MTPEQIARVCHEINRAYCEAIGDISQKPWEEAPDWQKASAIQGVRFALERPEVTPAEMHQSWCDQKLKDGWRVGLVKDAGKKEHPCLVDYEELPRIQRVKDHLFRATVRTLSGDRA
jgi:hypothetical protein